MVPRLIEAQIWRRQGLHAEEQDALMTAGQPTCTVTTQLAIVSSLVFHACLVAPNMTSVYSTYGLLVQLSVCFLRETLQLFRFSVFS